MKAIRQMSLAVLLSVASSHAGEMSPELQQRMQQARSDERIPVVVQLARQAIDELVVPPGLPRAERRRFVTEQLQRVNSEAQDWVALGLEASVQAGKGGLLQRFWLANSLAVDATPEVIADLAANPEVQSLGINQEITIEVLEDQDTTPETPPAVNGIHRIRAPQVWTSGLTGFGAVVGSIDTGVAWQNDDLQYAYRGGSNSWLDVRDGSPTPTYSGGHGTHTIGSAVGRNYVGENFIGAAPSAQWIACKAFKGGTALFTHIMQCMDWMANPDGNATTDDLPDVVVNSYGLSTFVCDPILRSRVQAWRALDIVPVYAAGNNGIPSIPAMYPEAISVGAVDRSNVVTSFSGRGPSPCDGTIYPKLAAPGTKVRSAWPPNKRKNLKGTSMATPHVAGTVALLRDYNPELTVNDIERILKQTALPLGPAGPDNEYGYGMVDAYRAMVCAQTGNYLCTATCP